MVCIGEVGAGRWGREGKKENKIALEVGNDDLVLSFREISVKFPAVREAFHCVRC